MNMKKIATMLIVLVLSFAMFSVAYADATETVSNAADLKAVLAKYSNKTTGKNLGTVTINITAGSVIEGDFTLPQRTGTNLIIEGNGSTIKGKMVIDGDSESGPETLTIKNLVFDATGLDTTPDYVVGQSNTSGDSSGGADDSVRYPRNITIDSCTFKGNSGLAAIKVAQNQGFVKIINCTAEGMHSLLQASSSGSNPITVDGCTVTNPTNGRGVSLGNAQNATVKNSTFDVASDKYAVRTDLNSSGSTNVSITGNTFKGGQPIVVRKTDSTYSHSLTVAGNTYSELTVEENDKVITLEDNAELDMFTGEEQAISDEENTFKASATEPSAEPTTKPAPTPAPSSSPISTPPKSGDETNLLGWMLLSGLSFVGIVCLGKKRLSKR